MIMINYLTLYYKYRLLHAISSGLYKYIKMLEICPRGNNKDYYLLYFPLMINVYYLCYNCINRKQIHVWNINDKVSLVCLS